MHKNITISLLCQYGLFTNTSVYTKWYAEAAIYAKNLLFFSFYSFLVKFSEWHSGSVRVKLTKCEKVKMGWKMPLCKRHTFWMTSCLIWLICHFIAILFYTERKWLLMKNVAIIVPLKSKSSGKFQRFNTIHEIIQSPPLPHPTRYNLTTSFKQKFS